MNDKRRAFTLIELIVSLLILIILGIILFVSFLSYLSITRDLSRIMTFKNIESIMYSYILKTGFFPTPSNPVEIFYSGGLVWTQGTYTNEISNIIGYSNDVVDPLTKNLYTYSVKNFGTEFSLAGVLERNNSLSFNNGFILDTYAEVAGTEEGIALVYGNYNGELLSVNNGSITYILALPSIITSDLSSNDLTYILNNNKLVYNNFGNLPYSYEGSIYKTDNNIDFSANNLIVFSGAISDLKQQDNRILLLQNLYNTYSGSILGNNLPVNNIDNIELFTAEPSNNIKILACDLINLKLKYFVDCD